MDRSAWESRYHLLDTNNIERAVPTLAGACEVQMTISYNNPKHLPEKTTN